MSLLFLILLALAPVFIISLFVYFKDKQNKEPFRLIILALALGMLSIIPAIILELIGNSFFDKMTMFNTFIYAFFVVSLSEEGVKFFVLRKFFYRKDEFNERFDGIVYSVMISMGFAAVENIMYSLNHGFGTAIMRIFTAVPAHAGFAIMMGYFVGKAKFATRFRTYYLFLGLFVAIIFHGLYDFFLLQNDSDSLKLFAFVTLIICILLSFKALNKKRKHLFRKNSVEEDKETLEEEI